MRAVSVGSPASERPVHPAGAAWQVGSLKSSTVVPWLEFTVSVKRMSVPADKARRRRHLPGGRWATPPLAGMSE